MGNKVVVKEREIKGQPMIEPKFRNPDDMAVEEFTDPDYRLKQLEKLNRGKLLISCSRCHHCR